MTGQVIDGERVRIILPAKGWVGVIACILSVFGAGAAMYYRHDQRIAALEDYRLAHEREVEFKWNILVREMEEIRRRLSHEP